MSSRWLTDTRDMFLTVVESERAKVLGNLASSEHPFHRNGDISLCPPYGTWQRDKGFHFRIIPLMDFILKALPFNTIILGNMFL